MTIISGGPVAVSFSAFSTVISPTAIPAGSTTVTYTLINTVNGGGPHGDIAFAGDFFNGGGGVLGSISVTSVATGGTGHIYNFAIPAGAVSFDISATPGPANNSNLASADADFNNTGPYCQYGAQQQGGAQFVYYLTPGLIDVWLSSVGLTWLAPFLTAAWFTTLSTANVCGSGPPVLPTITDPNPDNLPLDVLAQIIKAVAWPNICQCTPGSPGPTVPPPPTGTAPTGSVPFPTTTCSNADPCATLTDIWQDLANVQKQVNSMYELVTLIQRQAVPFAYVSGATHAGLTGHGGFAVQGILGLCVTFTGGGSVIGTEIGTPDTLFDVGWVNVGDGNGYRSRERIRSNPWVYFPQAAGEITLVGYTLNPLVTAAIIELKREP